MSIEPSQCPEALYIPDTDTLRRCVSGPGRHAWHKDEHGTQWRDLMTECERCNSTGIDPEDFDPGSGPTDYSMGEPPALEPCRNCGPGAADQ
ncbi:hypothetical protein [Streptomyces halstedii]|uniref:hypothetical protein n=1 Tax=Streptomyces halstedii TaxID=1944 RepID=UPI0037F19B9D